MKELYGDLGEKAVAFTDKGMLAKFPTEIWAEPPEPNQKSRPLKAKVNIRHVSLDTEATSIKMKEPHTADKIIVNRN